MVSWNTCIQMMILTFLIILDTVNDTFFEQPEFLDHKLIFVTVWQQREKNV